MSWLQRHREQLADAGWLLLALNVARVVGRREHLPSTAQLALVGIFAVFAVAAARRTPAAATTWARFRRVLPDYALAAGAGVAALLFGFKLPAHHATYVPVWLALAAAGRLPWSTLLERLRAWLRPWRGDVLAGDGLLVTIATWAVPAWANRPGPPVWMVGGLFAAWTAWHCRRAASQPRVADLPVLAAGWTALWWLGGGAAGATAAVGGFWLGLSLVAYRLAVRRWASAPADDGEVFRWIGLLGIVAVLLHPFYIAGVHGTGDALYYATFLADALEQFRAGVFPVFVGQSEFQFNGSVIPIRAAPAFQYVGGLVDLLTARQLGPMAVQNVVVWLAGLGTAFGTYGCSRRLKLPSATAWVLAVLYFSCPGVLGLAYNSDLYMSWLAVPILPWALLAALRTFQTTGPRAFALLGFAVGLTWWCHAPIALWLTLALASLQIVRFLSPVARGPHFGLELLAGAGAFALTAGYPLVSTIFFPTQPTLAASGGFVVPAADIVLELRQSFPAAWLPVSDAARRPWDFQLGWGLLALGVVALPAVRSSGRAALTLLGIAAVYLLLLIPIPGVIESLWTAVPAELRAITNRWPMQRLYVLVALAVLGLVALCWNKRQSPRWLLAAACLWGLAEAWKFPLGSWATMTPRSASAERLASENITLSRYSYGLFAGRPAYYTDGTTDPALENRLWDEKHTAVLADNFPAGAAQQGSETRVAFKAVANHLELEAPLTLVPGRRYLATLDLRGAPPAGVLVLEGRTLQRVYGVPEYGDARSFGFGGNHNPWMPLHTSQPKTESVRVLFEPANPGNTANLASRVHFVLRDYTPDQLPVRVDSWIPYRARVRTPTAAWLETPRMFQPGYAARVNGQPVAARASPEGLVSLPVPAGESTVELRYVAPHGLQAAFWVSFLGVIGGVALLVDWIVRDAKPLNSDERR